MVKWHLLPSLGKLLFNLAQLLSAADYQEHYTRDLGHAALQAANQGEHFSPLLFSSILPVPHAISGVRPCLQSLLTVRMLCDLSWGALTF